MVNVREGGRVVVGPGRYGDLNGNGLFGELGEEAAPADCHCVIRIDKRVKISSSHGALATILDAGGAQLQAVAILADGVTFGGSNGFTVTGTGGATIALAVRADNVKVSGNLAINNDSDGFGVVGDDNKVTRNLAIANGQNGFVVGGSNNRLKHNEANLNSGGGFFVGSGTGNEFRRNAALANSFGFGLVPGADPIIERNSAVGNGRTGVLLLGTSDPQADGRATVRFNNIYGNGFDDTSGGPESNCGLIDSTVNPNDARNNYWGAASGPGSDPADEICTFVEPAARYEPFKRRELSGSWPKSFTGS